MKPSASSAARRRPLSRWRAPVIAPLGGILVLWSAGYFATRPIHPARSALDLTVARVTVPERYRDWPKFLAAYGRRIPCPALRRTLQAIAVDDASISFPKTGEIKLFFDESGKDRDKLLSDAAKARLAQLLADTPCGS